MSDCSHTKVTRGTLDGHTLWTCIACADQFVPVVALDQVAEHIRAENAVVLDTVTAVFSAALWDLHTRSQATDEPPTLEKVCEDLGGCNVDDGTGKCIRCGKSPFLGG